jgi:galactonate dehydratase
MKAAHLCQEANKLCWLQLVGTGLTTAMAMHLGAVCQAAQWPAVTCMNMYQDQLLAEPLVVKGGFIRVPEKPGLGVEFNEAALRYRVPSPDKPNQDAIYAIVRGNGDRVWFQGEFGPYGYWTESWAGNLFACEHGVRLETWKNDGSKEWRTLRERLRSGMVRE